MKATNRKELRKLISELEIMLSEMSTVGYDANTIWSYGESLEDVAGKIKYITEEELEGE